MAEKLSNDFSFGTIMENLNNKIDIDFDNVKDKPATVAKILATLGFRGGNSLCLFGYVIQWGRLTLGKANAWVAVDLPIEMANNEYFCIAGNDGSNTTTYNVKVGNADINTTTQLKLLATNASTGVVWLVIGKKK